MSKGQTSYANKPAVGIVGDCADGLPEDIVSASNLMVEQFEVTVGTLQNTTLYRVTISYPSRVPATVGQTLTANIDYTSDGSATAAEIYAGLKAAADALDASIQVSGSLVDSVNGPLLLKADVSDLDFTVSAVSANLTSAESAAKIPFGVVVCKDGTSDKCRLPQLTTDVPLGIAKRTLGKENNLDGFVGYEKGEQVKVGKVGTYWATAEETVAEDDPVYFRIGTTGANSQKGALRKSPDGVAQVETLTPTAVNATGYQIDINGFGYFYMSDASATAAEIVTGLTTVINADSARNGVTASGSTTLILTANVAGAPFTVKADANQAIAHTTANSTTAVLLPNAKFKLGGSAGDLVKVRVQL